MLKKKRLFCLLTGVGTYETLSSSSSISCSVFRHPSNDATWEHHFYVTKINCNLFRDYFGLNQFYPCDEIILYSPSAMNLLKIRISESQYIVCLICFLFKGNFFFPLSNTVIQYDPMVNVSNCRLLLVLENYKFSNANYVHSLCSWQDFLHAVRESKNGILSLSRVFDHQEPF